MIYNIGYSKPNLIVKTRELSKDKEELLNTLIKNYISGNVKKPKTIEERVGGLERFIIKLLLEKHLISDLARIVMEY